MMKAKTKPQAPPDDNEDAPAPGFGGPKSMADMGPQQTPADDSGEQEPDQGDQQEGDQGDAGEGESGAREPATPEEQQQYDQIVAQALNLLSDPKNKPLRDKMATLLAAGKDRVMALGTASYYVFQTVFTSAQSAGKNFDAGVMLAAGEEINQHVATFGKVRKIADYSQDEIDGAFLKAVDLFRERNPGLLDPQAAQADLHEIQDADQSGTLDKVAPGLAGALGKLKGLGQKAQSQAPAAAPAGAPPAPQAGAPPDQGPQAAPQPGGE